VKPLPLGISTREEKAALYTGVPQYPEDIMGILMPALGQNWTCPFCGFAQVISDGRHQEGWHVQNVSNWADARQYDPYPTVNIESIICANQDCRRLTLTAALAWANRRLEITGRIKAWSLLPASSAKPQPDYIPEPLRNDYYEACAIRDLSPKASATLTRRCLQGMIRDFCKITDGRLIDEIKQLRKQIEAGKAPLGVQLDSVEAIDSVRKIGNIGAHMEKDINVIVDVDPDEAQILIELVETLFVEWYVAAESRKNRFGHLKAIAATKEEQKKLPAPETEGGK
jgi:hypothetical protein